MDLFGASGVEELIQDDDGYATLHSTKPKANTDHTALASSLRLSDSDICTLNKYSCTCTDTVACAKCKRLGFPKRPEWLLDSGASSHFTPLLSDLISYTPFSSPGMAGTAANPIAIIGFGTALLEYSIETKGKKEQRILRIEDVLFVPRITTRILSLGQFLKEGMRVYGDAAHLSLLVQGSKTMVLQAIPVPPHFTTYWLDAKSVNPDSIHSVFKVDFDLMHRHLGHPSIKVLCHAKSKTKGFPPIDFPKKDPICSGCALGKMAQKPFPESKN